MITLKVLLKTALQLLKLFSKTRQTGLISRVVAQIIGKDVPQHIVPGMPFSSYTFGSTCTYCSIRVKLNWSI